MNGFEGTFFCRLIYLYRSYFRRNLASTFFFFSRPLLPRLVALHRQSPFLSLLCFSVPCDARMFPYVISPSLCWSPCSSKSISWSPVCTSFCPSVVWISGDVSCPIPFLCQCVYEDICYSCLLSNSCAWNFILESYVFSIDRCVVCSLDDSSFVRDHVWQPYVIIGKMLWLNTLFFNVIGKSLSWKISLYFPKANPILL